MTKRRQADLCDVCDQPATARWRGHRPISICPTCAIEVLPRLAADAIDVSAADSRERVKWIVKRMAVAFWKALSMRLLKELK